MLFVLFRRFLQVLYQTNSFQHHLNFATEYQRKVKIYGSKVTKNMIYDVIIVFACDRKALMLLLKLHLVQ